MMRTRFLEQRRMVDCDSGRSETCLLLSSGPAEEPDFAPTPDGWRNARRIGRNRRRGRGDHPKPP